MLTPSRFYHLIAFFFLLVGSSACNDAGTVGMQLEDEPVGVTYTDTLTVKISTVLLDSVVSSGTGTVLVGQYKDSQVGTTVAEGYFQVNLETDWSLDERAAFDSIRLIVPYSSYAYGDTTATLSLQLQQLSQEITTSALSPLIGTEEPYSYFYSSAGIYNTSIVAADAQTIGSYSFKPRPNSKSDTIAIPLSAAIGREWLQKRVEQADQLTSPTSFLNYFKGIRMTATANSNAVIGFAVSGIKVRLYYREPSGDKTINSYHDFPLITGSTQFNHIWNEFDQSPLNTIKRGGDPISSEKLNNVGYIQAGTGLMVKLEFPYLNKIKEATDVNLINQALLEVIPMAGTGRYPTAAPDSLTLYQTDVRNVPLGIHVQDYATTEQSVALRSDDEFNQTTRYQFKVTQYITDLLKNGAEGKSILVGTPAKSYIKTVNRLVVGGPANPVSKVKLKIYFTRLN